MLRKNIYPWQRYWIKQGENPAIERGYFVEPSERYRWFGLTSNGVHLVDLKTVPCLILLGDVGMGKSTTVEKEANALKSSLAGQKHEVLYKDLKRLPEAQLVRSIFDDLIVQGWLKGEHSLTLFLDSLDEGWRRIDALELILVDEFERRIRKDTPPLFLRINCRSAEWRGEAGKAIERLFPTREGINPVQIFVLAPLSENNIRVAAKENQVDGDLLLKSIASKDAQALASHPITLEMLLELYKEKGDFPKSRVELYQEGCLRLCADQGSSRHRKTTPKQRLAIAGRLAAVTIFTNRLLINGDLENSLCRSDVLEIGEILGFFEERVGGERVPVDKDTILDTLQTALFTERVGNAQTWRHQSYAEFLAAYYLHQRQSPISQICSLLTEATGNRQRIIPQLEETASWAAEMDHAVFERLATYNADVLLRCDSTFLLNVNRPLLVKNYLELIRLHESVQLDWQLKNKYARLSHSELGAQLRPIVTDKNENPLVRETAIDIAGICKLNGLKQDLIEIFCDSTEIFRIRKHAGIALRQGADDEIRSLLRKRNIKTWDGDIDDDLKGYYFQIMWPSHITLDDLLPLLAPKIRHYTGPYKIFLEHELPETLSTSDLPRILDWFREVRVDFDIIGDFGYLPSKVFLRALSEMAYPSVRDAVLRLLNCEQDNSYRLFRRRDKEADMPKEVRITFWKAIVGSNLDISKLIHLGGMISAGMLSREDIATFISEYRNCSDEKMRAGWRIVMFSVFFYQDADALELIWDLAKTDVAVKEALISCTTCKLLPDKENWVKQNFLREQREHNKKSAPKPALEELIIHALDAFEQGDLKAYWYVFEMLDREPENLERAGVNLCIAKQKSWKCLTDATRHRILRGALPYLRRQSVNDKKVWEKEHRYRPYDVLNPLLVLLFDEDKQILEGLTTEDWSKWVGVFISYGSSWNGSHDEAYREILSLSFAKAKESSMAVLKHYLDAEINNDSKRIIIWNLSLAWCAEIRQTFVDLLRKPLRPNVVQDILQLLTLQQPVESEVLLASMLEQCGKPEKCSMHVPSAIAVLLMNFPNRWADRILSRIKADSALGKVVIPRLLRGCHNPPGWLSQLSARDLAELWEWLSQHYPGDPYERDNGSGEVKIEHEIYHFRNAVFQALTTSDSPDACDVIVELMRRRRDDFWLGDVLAEMRKTRQRRIWVRSSPMALMQILISSEKRLVRTAGELQSLVIDSFRRYEAELHSSTPKMELWNEATRRRQKLRQPKNETNLSNCLKYFLERDLKERGVIANREVQIRQGYDEDAAQLVDILVQVVPLGEDGRASATLSVILEIKCAWNRGVLLDMQHQLFDRYLKNSDLNYGIYAVAYFTCDAWNWKNDRRKAQGESRNDIEILRQKLSEKAALLSSEQKSVEAIVLDARLGID